MYYRPPTSINPHAPIHVTSPNLTRITNALDARRQDRLNYGAKYRALANRLRPDSGPSVVRHERPVEKSTIDLTNRSAVPGKKETPSAIDEDARLADDAARIERGESLEEMPDVRPQMSHVARKAAATEVVIEKLESEFQAEFLKLSATHIKTIKPTHDAQTRKFFMAFGDAFSIYSELQKTKRDLIDSQIGFGGLFTVDLGFMNSEEVRSAFADGKAHGYVTSLPKPKELI
jgi:hypothetical protein